MSSSEGGGEILLEFVRVGVQLRVSAIDAKTGVEVVIVAPANAPRSQIEKVAVAKLKRKLASGT